jgi:ABC-2 type transport system permease protein
MTVIYRRELNAYFKGFIGYVVVFLMLVFAGIFFAVINLAGGSPEFFNVFYNIFYVLITIAAVSILSMRVVSEERHQRTDQLLYSLPTTMTRVVLGKYLAMVTVMALPIAVMAVYPLIMHAYGTTNLLVNYGSLFAYFLLCASLLSIGIFISSLTENQIVAIVLCFIVLVADYVVQYLVSALPAAASVSLIALTATILAIGFILWLLTRNAAVSGGFALLCEAGLVIFYILSKESFTGLFGKVMQAICVFSPLNDFMSGVFNLQSIVYFLAVIAIFLFLTVQSMEKRRWN